MIESDEELSQTIRAMEHLYRGLAAVRRDVLPRDERYFALMAEGPVDEIRKFQREIDEYVGLSLAEELHAKHWGHLSDEDDRPEPVGTTEQKASAVDVGRIRPEPLLGARCPRRAK